jgi:4-oxalocrotonate tautomerase
MPIVHVELFAGRSVEQKRELVRGITEVVARTCGVAPDGVHVLINEMSRENWGRGSVMHIDRTRAEGAGSAVATGDFVVVATAGAAPTSISAPPTNQLGLVVASADDSKGDFTISSWSSEDAWRSNGGRPDDATMCDRVDLPDGGGLRGMPLLQRHMTISTHEVRPEKLDEYLELRRIAVNPGMARLHGFVSSDVLRKRSTPNAFFIVNQWLTKEDSDRYTEDSLHQYLKSRVRPLLISHSGTREFAVVTPEKD